MNTIIVGEIGINHNGDINIIKQLIDVCSNLGIQYVKFQTRNIESCYTEEQLDSYRESPWGTTFRQQKEGLELSLDQYKEIHEYCKVKGNIGWFSSPWDLTSIDFLDNYFPTMPYLKIPSAKLKDYEFLSKCNSTNIPLIMSTGMSDLSDVTVALKHCPNTVYLLGCTSAYPCPIKDINLNQIKILNHYFGTYDRMIGWSDHSGGILFPSVAVALGVKIVEVHITKDRKMYGTDQAASIEPEGLEKLVKYIKALEVGLGGVIKEIKDSELPIIKKLRG